MVGLTAILREAWTIASQRQTEDRREKIQDLSLAKECYSMKLDLLTNASLVDDAMRFVIEKQQYNETERKTSFSQSKDNGKESVGPDYNEEDSDIQSKEKHSLL